MAEGTTEATRSLTGSLILNHLGFGYYCDVSDLRGLSQDSALTAKMEGQQVSEVCCEYTLRYREPLKLFDLSFTPTQRSPSSGCLRHSFGDGART